MKKISFIIILWIIATGLCIIVGSIYAQSFPSRPIKIIVPFPAGGTTDILARILSSKLTENLGQHVLVENRPGASGIIGTEILVKSPPDGYTLMITATHHVANPALYKKVPFDILKDITNIALIAIIPNVLLAHPTFPPNSVEELIALAKSKPGQINYASTGIGGANHLCGEMFKIMAKIDIVHIPYKGQAPAFNDLLAGHVPLMFNTIDVSLPHLKVGRLKALGVTSAKRSQVASQIPTISESGLPGYENVSWFGLYGPPNMEKDIISKLNFEFVKVLHTPDIIKRFNEFGAEPGRMGVHEFDAYVRSEYAKISKLIKDLGIKLD